ncbi:MAG: hypothetical protein ACT4TC_03200 [Myxococcaceae bacterium]
MAYDVSVSWELPPGTVFAELAWAQASCGLTEFLNLDERAPSPVAHFSNGDVHLKAGNGALVVDRVELRNGGRPLLFDPALLRIARLYRLAPFNLKQSDPQSGSWIFGETHDAGSAALMRAGTGGFALTLQPGTRSATVLKHADHFVSPLYFAEDVLSRVDVGRVLRAERTLVRCEEAEVLLSRERHTGEMTSCLCARAIRFPNERPVPLTAFHLAAQVELGAFTGWSDARVTFEHGEMTLEGNQIVDVRHFVRHFNDRGNSEAA